MVLIAGIILMINQFVHGLGLVWTKKLKETNVFHVNYFVGLMMFFFNSTLASAVDKSDSYHWPSPY